MVIMRIENILKKYWGFDTFLPLQKEAIQCVMNGRDSLVVLPTGGGKSLCFQAPAMAMSGLTIVVSPLISLMKDQVDALRECGVPAARLDSSMYSSEQDTVFSYIHKNEIKLLYLSPERLVAPDFIEFLKKIEIAFFAIDETHCVSIWGHDFRPEYRRLNVLKHAFPEVAVHAYTATATERVRSDIITQLHLANPEILVGSFDRPNLVYSVRHRTDRLRQVCAVIDRHQGESGIIYCIRRDDVDQLCRKLAEEGYRVAPYHAGMDNNDRKKSQDAFIEGTIDTIVATIAFGMGIDKSNVRYVAHTGMPKSLEYYQQETGRAGRDGLEAECILLYSPGDFMIWNVILENMEEEEAQKIARFKLKDMYRYCAGVECRRKILLNYFGQLLAKKNCGACDVCSGDVEYIDDPLETAQKILSCVIRLEERFGAVYTAAVLVGSREHRILDNLHNEISTYGLLDDFNKRVVCDWIEQIVTQGYLLKTGEYNVLKVTQKGWRLLNGEEAPKLLKPAGKPSGISKIAADSWEGVDKDLFETLRALRQKIAADKEVPAYIVFGDAALRDMARRKPSTHQDFLMVNGVGERKNEEYGDAFLSAIHDYCKMHALEMDVILPEVAMQKRSSRREPRPKRNDSKQRAFELFEEGRHPDEVAQIINRVPSTTVNYLVEYIKKEKLIAPNSWIDIQTFRRVQEAATQLGAERLKTVYEALNGEVSYDQIKISLACLDGD